MKLTANDVELIINQHILHLSQIDTRISNIKIDTLEGLLYRSSGISNYKTTFKIINDYKGEIIKESPIDYKKLEVLQEIEVSIRRCAKYKNLETYFDKVFRV
jgi:hypothetical protein